MIFFRPTRSYVQWLVAYAAGRLIIDVGCGECYLLKKIRRMRGLCLGIDPYVSHELAHEMLTMGVQVVPLEAEEFSMVNRMSGSLLVIPRPSHCGFVERTLRANAGNEVLYISKPENVALDIPSDFRATPIPTPRCRSERTYQITGSETCLRPSKPATLPPATRFDTVST